MKTRIALRLIVTAVVFLALLPLRPAPHIVNASPQVVRPAAAQTPLGELPNPNGSPNPDTGFSAALDSTGQRPTLAVDSAPATLPPPSGVWQAMDLTGLNGNVRAIAVAGPDVYVGGDFTDAGGIPEADYIARWDGAQWHAVGGGLNGSVRAITVAGQSVYVGGNFTDAGGDANADRIAVWETRYIDFTPYEDWYPLGSGLNATVRAIVVAGDSVYAGGDFTNAGGNADADYIACWRDDVWSPITPLTWLMGPLEGSVYAMALAGADLYIGGTFASFGSLEGTSYIFRWNIFEENFHTLGEGLNARVYTIAVAGANVYAGGNFTDAGGDASADYVARWDGAAWHSLGSGVNERVWSLAVVGPNVYVGGYFTDAGANASADYIARWNGAAWNSVGGGLNGWVYVITEAGPQVYVGGAFTDAGGNAGGDCVARWNTTPNAPDWDALGEGLNNTVQAIVVAGPDVYVGGWFTDVGGNASADGIARWDGSSWQSLGSGIQGVVYAIAVAGRDVYVGGTFTNAGGNANADYIARWDGSTWHALSGGLNNYVFTIATVGADVYVGGIFTDAGGNAGADRIARWDGAAWHALGSGLNDRVWSIAVAGPDVYVGGDFTNAGGDANADYIAVWHNDAWFPLRYGGLGVGLNNSVYALAVAGPNLYVGGAFTNAGDVTDANYIARWHFPDFTWNIVGIPTGPALNNYVSAIAVAGKEVYIGGGFTDAQDNPDSDRIARLDYWIWRSLGNGANDTVLAITIAGAEVYAGGKFTNVSGAEGHIARWGTVYRPVFLPLVLNNHNPDRSALTDPAGDWLPGAVQLASTDIRAASIERLPAESVLVLTMQLAGNLPATLPDNERNRWVWLLDTDRNASTGTPWYDLGVEYEVNLHIQQDGFYVDVRDTGNNWTPVPGAATISGDTVTVRLPMSYLGGATRCNWMAVVEPFAREGTRFDIAPNSGYAQLP